MASSGALRPHVPVVLDSERVPVQYAHLLMDVARNRHWCRGVARCLPVVAAGRAQMFLHYAVDMCRVEQVSPAARVGPFAW